MRKKLSLASLACLPLFACGGDSGGSNKTVKVVDAKVFLDGSAAVACKAPASYPNAGSAQRAIDHAGNTGGSAHTHVQVFISQMGSDDFLEMLMFAGGSGGTWAGTDIAPATIDLAQLTELNPELDLFPMAVLDGSGFLTDDTLYNGRYIGVAGTINLTAAGGGSGTKLTGTFTNVELDHLLVDSSSGAISDPMDGCMTTISGSFTATLSAGAASFQGGNPNNELVRAADMRTLQHRHF
jgi:hypothetical protein